MILTIWIFLAFTCYTERIHASPNSTEDEPPKSASSSNETIVINSTTSNPDPQKPINISTIPEECPSTGCVKCSPIALCAASYDEIQAKKAFCKIDATTIGVICPQNERIRSLKPRSVLQSLTDTKIHKISSRAIAFNERQVTSVTSQPTSEDDERNTVKISSEEAYKGVQQANVSLQQKEAFEKDLQSKGFTITKVDTPEFSHLQFFKTASQSVAIAKIGFLQEFASTAVSISLKLTADQARVSLPKTIINPIAGCPPPPTCTLIDNFYRRHDGGCNNKRFTNWGRSFTPFARKTALRYDLGISIPRRSVFNQNLPSARKISSKVALDVDKPSSKFTLSVMQWGQYIDHDLTHSSISRYGGTTGIQCCGSTGPLPPSQSHPECFPIEIPADDPFYFAFGRRCMNFVRSLPAPNADCNTLGPRNQMNQVTHYLDGSAVYGSTDEANRNLRQFTGGLLKVRPGDLLPEDTLTPTTYDFLAGDSRVNEQPHLSVIHTIWAREHNRVAKFLSDSHFWDDETIYQETRKIIVAEIQHIVYNEWLPLILGPTTMDEFGLSPLTTGFLTEYSEVTKPFILNEFATAAFRFGHTLVQGNLKLYDINNVQTQTIELSNNFDKPLNLVTPITKFDEFVRGLYQQPMQEFDNCVVDDLTNKLFKPSTTQEGLDLVALNIQRGRDHGIGTFNDFRDVCHKRKAVNFGSLNTYMQPSTVAAFQSLYGSVEDLDAFIAGISEKPVPDGIVGETFNCIITDQFFNLKYGDRFFYENGRMPSSFSTDQLTEIRKVSWARILCDNDQNIKEIQPLAFRLSDTSLNVKTLCSDTAAIPTVDLNQW